MDALKKRKERKGNLIIKTWERCKSIGRSRKPEWVPPAAMARRRLDESTGEGEGEGEEEEEKQRSSRKRRVVAPEGCFSVYVGPQKQRFVIKTKCVNHPLFKLLLEEAESEYGFHSEGPLVLPCKVDVFFRVLLAMDDHNNKDDHIRQGCGFAIGSASLRLLSPPRMIAAN